MKKLDWNNFYILGAFDQNGEPRFTAWCNDESNKRIEAVITHNNKRVELNDVPFGKDKALPGIIINEIPNGIDGYKLARDLDGIFVFGWYFENEFKRKE